MTTIEKLNYEADSLALTGGIARLMRQAAAELEALQKEVAELKSKLERNQKSVDWADETRLTLAKELGLVATASAVVTAVKQLRKQNAELRAALGKINLIAGQNTIVTPAQGDMIWRIVNQVLATQPKKP